jgi:hypothetical protein
MYHQELPANDRLTRQAARLPIPNRARPPAGRDACTEAIMLAHGFTPKMRDENDPHRTRDRAAERMIAGGKSIEIAHITNADQRTLTER